MPPKMTPDRLRSKTTLSDTGCWEWTGCLDAKGYAHTCVRIDEKVEYRAYRVAYRLFVGPIPDGLTLDHLCRNTKCINPQHLEPVTHRVNILRSNNAAARHARQTHCVNGHPFDEANTYLAGRGDRVCRACSAAAQRRYQARLRAARFT